MLVPIHERDGMEKPAGGRVMKETKMSYADTLLAKDETIVYRARQFWLAPVSDARNPLLLLLLGIVLALVEHQVLNWSLRSIAGFVDLILILVALVWIAMAMGDQEDASRRIDRATALKANPFDAKYGAVVDEDQSALSNRLKDALRISRRPPISSIRLRIVESPRCPAKVAQPGSLM